METKTENNMLLLSDKLKKQIDILTNVFNQTKIVLEELSDEFNRIQTEMRLEEEFYIEQKRLELEEDDLAASFFMSEYDAIKREWEDEQRELELMF